MNKKKIILLAGKGASTNIIYHALKYEWDISAIILEEAENKSYFLKRRIKKLGIWKVVGQILFQLTIVKFLNITSTKRKNELFLQYELNTSNLPEEKIIHVISVNDNKCLQILQNINPDIVIVNGTRIISKQILQSIPAKFLNIHVGITPKYRGVHGGYWALVNNDISNCGVTIHLIDAGIDTGSVIYQQQIAVTAKDNFVTYPLIQLATGIPYLKTAIRDILLGQLILKKGTDESCLWSHPTLRQYVYYRIVHKKK
jgi:folate-dependent phosphoribosylglycinamide formyltransferase PurN